MTKPELEAILQLHDKAYSFLISCGRTGRAASQAFDSSVVAAFRNSEDSGAWIRCHYQELPLEFRPGANDIDAFAQLLCSYLTTSFTLLPSRSGFRLQSTRNLRSDGTRKPWRSKAKEQFVAQDLCRLALRKLAEELDCPVDREEIEQMLADYKLTEAISLWAYASQLVQRSKFFSQGPAVHRLWLSLSENSRRRFSTDLVWSARDRLVQHFQTLYTHH